VGDQIFEERLRDCSCDLFVPALRLHPAVRHLSGATSATIILPDDRSRDCTAHIFLHRLCTATSNKHTEMSRVNGATNDLSISPSTGYTLFFVFMHVSLLFIAYVNSYIHMHIHVITYIALFF
jgi:hypothetical protein